MKNLNLDYPTVSEEQKQALLVATEELEREDGGVKDKAVLKAEEKAAADHEVTAASSAVTEDEVKKRGKKGRQEKKARRKGKVTSESRVTRTRKHQSPLTF